jgi:hypothetical protein
MVTGIFREPVTICLRGNLRPASTLLAAPATEDIWGKVSAYP